jgi:hypothetical protein
MEHRLVGERARLLTANRDHASNPIALGDDLVTLIRTEQRLGC